MTSKSAKKSMVKKAVKKAVKKPAKKSSASSQKKKVVLKKSTASKKPAAKKSSAKSSAKTKVSVCATRPEVVAKHYASLEGKFERYRKELGRGLTLGEKILFSHLDNDCKQRQRRSL